MSMPHAGKSMESVDLPQLQAQGEGCGGMALAKGGGGVLPSQHPGSWEVWGGHRVCLPRVNRHGGIVTSLSACWGAVVREGPGEAGSWGEEVGAQ